jgi:hypothetical protein
VVLEASADGIQFVPHPGSIQIADIGAVVAP